MDDFSFSDKFKEEHKDIYDKIYKDGKLDKFALILVAHNNGISIQLKIKEMAKQIQDKLIGEQAQDKPNGNQTNNAIINDDPYKIVPFTQSVVEETDLYKVYSHLINFKNKIDAKDGRGANVYLTTMSDFIFEKVTDSMVTNYVYYKEMTKWRDVLDKGIAGTLQDNDLQGIGNEIAYILARISKEFARVSNV